MQTDDRTKGNSAAGKVAFHTTAHTFSELEGRIRKLLSVLLLKKLQIKRSRIHDYLLLKIISNENQNTSERPSTKPLHAKHDTCIPTELCENDTYDK
jgi:hypothetical protein